MDSRVLDTIPRFYGRHGANNRMKKNPKLRKSLSDFSRRKQPVEDTYYGELGIPLDGSQVVNVPG
jgi:hypothetical protein